MCWRKEEEEATAAKDKPPWCAIRLCRSYCILGMLLPRLFLKRTFPLELGTSSCLKAAELLSAVSSSDSGLADHFLVAKSCCVHTKHML